MTRTQAPAAWRSRIVGSDEVAPDQLLANPRNWRIHPKAQQEALAGVLDRIGFVGQVMVNQRTGHLVDGHLRVELALSRGQPTIPVTYVDLSEEEEAVVLASLDPLASMAVTDDAKLGELLRGLELENAALEAHLAALLPDLARTGLTDPDEVPPVPDDSAVYVKPGDVWVLGDHRIMCGDSTKAEDVARLLDGASPVLIHADPPYGMGKESEGVTNDNLHGGDLDQFQMAWWNVWRPRLADNASAYIWGVAPDLWRLWWLHLAQVPGLMVRNEIVWDKGSVVGMRSALGHSFPPATERCLFLMLGEQFLGNQNKDDYWPGYEPLRLWLVSQRDAEGWTNGDINRITRSQMAGHWFGQSQFQPINRQAYETVAAAASSAFREPYDDLFARLFPGIRDAGNAHRRELSAELDLARLLRGHHRTYFDNAHESMTDVWTFSRVQGEERQGHATPKPVALVARAIKTSSPDGAAVGVPFSGSGPDIIAAETLGRRCYAMELEPRYVEMAIERWKAFTGREAVRDG